MSIEKSKGIAVLAEVVAVLARYSCMRVSPIVDREDGVVALRILVDAEGPNGLEVLALHDDLKFVADVAQVRAFASTYQIDPAKLQALLPTMADDQLRSRHLTVDEIDAVLAVLTEQTGPEDPPTHKDRLLDAATVKLVELSRALAGAV